MSSRIEDCLSPDVAPNGCACSGLHVTSDNHDCGPGMRKVTTSLPTLRGRLLRAYVSLAEGAVVGRIFNAKAAPVDTPWMWTLAFGHHENRTPTHGYEPTREAAMAAFAKSWRRES